MESRYNIRYYLLRSMIRIDRCYVQHGRERDRVVAQVDRAMRRDLYLVESRRERPSSASTLRTEHQNLLSEGMGGEESEELSLDIYTGRARAAGTTTNVSRYSQGIELQLARLSLGRFCRGVTRNMLVPPSTI